MLAEYGISQKEYQEAKNDKEIAIKLSDALDEIANGKIAVFGKMVEEAKQAKTNEEAAKLMTADTEKVKSETEKNKQDIKESLYRDWETKQTKKAKV